jgi:hypothetical protein
MRHAQVFCTRVGFWLWRLSRSGQLPERACPSGPPPGLIQCSRPRTDSESPGLPVSMPVGGLLAVAGFGCGRGSASWVRSGPLDTPAGGCRERHSATHPCWSSCCSCKRLDEQSAGVDRLTVAQHALSCALSATLGHPEPAAWVFVEHLGLRSPPAQVAQSRAQNRMAGGDRTSASHLAKGPGMAQRCSWCQHLWSSSFPSVGGRDPSGGQAWRLPPSGRRLASRR